METRLLRLRQLYAYREKRQPGEPMLKVRLLDIVGRKGKVKIRFEDGPHRGLEEYVATRQLVVPWGERKALLRDEERQALLDGHARGFSDSALVLAAGAVLESTGEPGADVEPRGCEIRAATLQRIMDRAGVGGEPARLHFLAFRDRHGVIHLPLEAAVALAQAFAAAEPHTVVGYLDDLEEEYRLRGNAPGERWWHGYLREMSPGFALARRWAGIEQEAELLRKEIARLRALLATAARDLSAAGRDGQARRLLRALEGG